MLIDVINVYALWKIYSIYETDAHAFGSLSIENVINTKIVYNYTDAKNNIQYDTFIFLNV